MSKIFEFHAQDSSDVTSGVLWQWNTSTASLQSAEQQRGFLDLRLLGVQMASMGLDFSSQRWLVWGHCLTYTAKITSIDFVWTTLHVTWASRNRIAWSGGGLTRVKSRSFCKYPRQPLAMRCAVRWYQLSFVMRAKWEYPMHKVYLIRAFHGGKWETGHHNGHGQLVMSLVEQDLYVPNHDFSLKSTLVNDARRAPVQCG